MPPRHLKVIQRSSTPSMTLLTHFGPELDIQSDGNVHHAQVGDISWTAIVGGGKADGLESDAHFAFAVRNRKKGRVELMRLGGSRLSFHGKSVISEADDVWSKMDN